VTKATEPVASQCLRIGDCLLDTDGMKVGGFDERRHEVAANLQSSTIPQIIVDRALSIWGRITHFEGGTKLAVQSRATTILVLVAEGDRSTESGRPSLKAIVQ
jgi:hypothetical protein